MEAISKEFIKKYGRLDWDCRERTNADKAKAGKRYEGLPILMNLNSGGILTCDVIQVTEQGFLVQPLSLCQMGGGGSCDIDFSQPIPYEKFFHVFLRNS